MLSHEEMIGLQAERHELVEINEFRSVEEYVLHLIHAVAYEEAAKCARNMTVLDLGCNNGYGSKIIHQSCKQVVGVDVSRKAIATARSLYGGSGIRFELTDGKGLEFKDGMFDLIVNFQVIEHVVSYKDYVSEIKRVLASSGIVMFTTPNALLRLDPGMEPWNPFHVREFSAPELKDVLSDYFEEVRVYGLFANEPLYSIEFNRIKRARDSARRKKGQIGSFYHSLRCRVRTRFPRYFTGETFGIRRVLRRTRAHNKADQVDEFQEKYTTGDLFYKDGDLEGALDLMAICGADAGILESRFPDK